MDGWRDLHDGWLLRAAPGSTELPASIAERLEAGIPATVPGCVHTDLLAAGLIDDPYLDCNEDSLRWIGRADWVYSTEFGWEPGADETDRVDLVCDGLDTIATVSVNGTEVGRSLNMHRSYRWQIGELLSSGSNRLEVAFGSPDRYAAEQKERLGDLPGPNSATPEPFNFIRKMACNFGWDWGPVLTTAGIWRPIRLHTWRSARLAAVRPQVTVDGIGERTARVGRVRVDVSVAAGNAPETVVVARIAGRETRVDAPTGSGSVTLELEVSDPELWWPHTLGGQRLYDLDVELLDADGEPLDRWHRRVGFRSVRLNTEQDAIGSAFTLEINEVPIFARAANWIPDDCFPSRVDAARYRARLEQSAAANIDLLRIWGGGIYESDEFYAACDELGILVWQDFPFACAAYPEEEPFGTEVEAEARENVVRLMPHPSLVLWNGNNENIWGAAEWGWAPRLEGRTWGAGYYFDLLPKVVAELDPTRPYWPGSPYSGTRDLPVNADDYGCAHVWDVWNQRDYPIYRSYIPRFVAEFGWQGPPTWSTLTRAITERPLTPDSPGMLAHQKATGGNDKLARGLAPHFDPPDRIEDWHWAMQLNQARAIELAIDHYRSHRGRCMGTVVWQINDCWPVTSWAAIDGDGRPKPLWYALRRVYRPRTISVQPRGSGGLHLVAVNDTRTPWRLEASVDRRGFDGSLLAGWGTSGIVEPLDRLELDLPASITEATDPSVELLVASADGSRATWFFAEDRDLAYPPAEWKLSTEPTSDGGVVTVTAGRLVRDLALFADRIEPSATCDDMLITLLPGERHSFTITGLGRPLIEADLDDPAVIRCANDLVTRT